MLDALKPESRVLELRDMLLGGASHADCKSWLALECGAVVKGKDTLTRFYRRHCQPIVDERRSLAAVKAEGIVDGAGRTDWDAATIELVKQVAFEVMSDQSIDPKKAEKFVGYVIKLRQQDTDRAKLQSATRSKIEEGLDALFAEIKGNRKAETLFTQLQEVVKAA